MMNVKNNYFGIDYAVNHDDKDYLREKLIFDVTEDLLVIMEDLGFSKKTLSESLGTSKAHVSQLLSGSRNMTLGTFSDICFALGFKPEIKIPLASKTDFTSIENEKTLWIGKKEERRKKRIVRCKDNNGFDRGDCWISERAVVNE